MLRDSDTDAVLEIMSKERPNKVRTGQHSSMGKAHRLGEANATFQNASTFDVSQGIGESSYITERRPMRSSRVKKANKMVISMTLDQSSHQRSKSRSLSKSKKKVALVG